MLKKHLFYKQTGALGSGIVGKPFGPLLFGANMLKSIGVHVFLKQNVEKPFGPLLFGANMLKNIGFHLSLKQNVEKTRQAAGGKKTRRTRKYFESFEQQKRSWIEFQNPVSDENAACSS